MHTSRVCEALQVSEKWVYTKGVNMYTCICKHAVIVWQGDQESNYGGVIRTMSSLSVNARQVSLMKRKWYRRSQGSSIALNGSL